MLPITFRRNLILTPAVFALAAALFLLLPLGMANACDCGECVKNAGDTDLENIMPVTLRFNDQKGQHTKGKANRLVDQKDFCSPDCPKSQLDGDQQADLTDEAKSVLGGMMGGLFSNISSMASNMGMAPGGGSGTGKYNETSNDPQSIVQAKHDTQGCQATGANSNDYRGQSQ